MGEFVVAHVPSRRRPGVSSAAVKVHRPSPTNVPSARRRSAIPSARRDAGLSTVLDARSIVDLQKKTGNQSVRHALEAARSLVMTVVTSGAGRPLDDVTRARLEQQFGLDLSDVRVHTDERASTSAALLGAHAYAIGDDIAFQRGLYRPHSDAGMKILAHEIAHVVQHRAADVPARPTAASLRLADPTGRLEHDAERRARAAPLPPTHSLPQEARGRSR